MAEKTSSVIINYYDSGGGAAQVAWDLAEALDVPMIVGEKHSTADFVSEIPKSGFWNRYYFFCDFLLKIFFPDTGFMRKVYSFFPRRLRRILFDRPVKTRELFARYDERFSTYRNLRKIKTYRNAEIVHLQNIHGGYFDLSALAQISKEKPIIWTLHDMWAVTGGEAHTFGETSFVEGKAETPYNVGYPFSRHAFKDRRKKMMRRKRKVYSEAGENLFIVADSNWVKKIVEKSWAFRELRYHIETIYPGIETRDFPNQNRRSFQKPRILFFDSGSNFKNAGLFYNAMKIVIQNNKQFDLSIKSPCHETELEFEKVPFLENREDLIDLYNSHDILIFPSAADTFPLVVLEAMSCGMCVIATPICGVTEQIDHKVNGLLSDSLSPNDLANQIIFSIENIDIVRNYGQEAAKTVREKFDISLTINGYKALYQRIIERNK